MKKIFLTLVFIIFIGLSSWSFGHVVESIIFFKFEMETHKVQAWTQYFTLYKHIYLQYCLYSLPSILFIFFLIRKKSQNVILTAIVFTFVLSMFLRWPTQQLVRMWNWSKATPEYCLYDNNNKNFCVLDAQLLSPNTQKILLQGHHGKEADWNKILEINPQELILEGFDLLSIPFEIFEIENLQKLTFQRTNIGNIRGPWKKLTKLEHLKITQSKILMVHADLFDANGLQSLEISNNDNYGPDYIPDEIQNLKNLEILILHGNRIHKISSKISNLQNLKYLDVSNNVFKELNEYITQIPSLTYLLMAGNRISKISPEVDKMNFLQYLDLSNNKLLNAIPAEIFYIQDLKYLNLKDTKLSILPNSLPEQNRLKTIILPNSVKKLPESFSQAHDLHSLTANHELFKNWQGDIPFKNLKYIYPEPTSENWMQLINQNYDLEENKFNIEDWQKSEEILTAQLSSITPDKKNAIFTVIKTYKFSDTILVNDIIKIDISDFSAPENYINKTITFAVEKKELIHWKFSKLINYKSIEN